MDRVNEKPAPLRVKIEKAPVAVNEAAPFREGPRYTVRWKTESILYRSLLRCCVYALQGRAEIEDRDGDKPIKFCNWRVGQVHLMRQYLSKARAHEPCRVLVPKYRRHGISTAVQFVYWFHGLIWNRRNAVTVAHKDEATIDIFKLAKNLHAQSPLAYLKYDPENWKYGCAVPDKWQQAWRRRTQKLVDQANHDHSESSYTCTSGGGNFAKSGATTHFLHVSEYAKFMSTSAQDATQMQSLVNSMSQTRLDTITTIESSGQGSDGDFPARVRTAISGGGTYALCFIPWSWDPTLCVDEDDIPESIDPPLSGYELTLRDRYECTIGQILWRRGHIADHFPGSDPSNNPPSFGWDYPITPEDLFSQKEGRVYLPFNRSKHFISDEHAHKFYPLPAERRRFIDWGFSDNHAAVCIWVAIDRTKPPELVVLPGSGCESFVTEHENYARDKKSGKVLKVNDHSCDAFRIGIFTLGIRCRVIVYRVYHKYGEHSPTTLARKIHQLSGWVHKGGKDHPNLRGFKPGAKGETYQAGVADRSEPGIIRDFRLFGIPLQPSTAASGEVEDGINRVLVLMEGGVTYELDKQGKDELLLASLKKKLDRSEGIGRPKKLTREEMRLYRRLNPQVDMEEHLTGGPSSSMVRAAEYASGGVRRLIRR